MPDPVVPALAQTELQPSAGRHRLRIVACGVAALGLAAMALWSILDRQGDDGSAAATGKPATARQTTLDGPAADPAATSAPASTSSSLAAANEPSRAGAAQTPVTEPELEPHELALPEDGPAMIVAIDEAELAIRNTDLTNAQLDSWGRRQQSLYRHLSFHSDWATEVLEGVDPNIQNAVTLNWSARQNLSALVNTETRHDELPAWRVVPPLPPQTLIGYYKQAEADHGISWEFLAAINLVETRMGRIEGISTAGAIGPMQFLPTTWAECCDGNPAVPADAIAGAAKYLTIRGGPENMNRAIFGYNNSDYYVDAVTAYATVIMENERAYYGYHAWEIYFLSTEGLIRIPVGYEQLEPIAATAWLSEHPETLFSR